MEAQEANTEVEQTQNRDDDDASREDFGKMLYGCEHYRRRCKIRAPCCDKIFTCRHCHNEATSALSNPKERHEIVRHDVKQVVCAACDTEQQVAKLCSNCGVKFGEYFCDICKFYDDDITKGQFHCSDCGICRVGGRYNYFHCPKCGSCYAKNLRNNHLCVEDSMKNHCPICYEFLFDSTKQTRILKCGHTMHVECHYEMFRQNQYRCPICSKSLLNMSRTWETLDQEIEATAMPEEYCYEVQILCNDCNNRSTAFFHIFGHKCRHCNSYNTRVITNGESHGRATFYRIIKKKSTEGFQAIPYAVALFSAMLYLYYAFLKEKDIILITINTVGFIMEITYLTIYIIYATKKSRVFTTMLLLVFNVSSLGFIIGGTYFFAKGPLRVTIVGWICAVFSVSVFAAPLTIMTSDKNQEVEFMPFSLSFFLTICSVVWFFYGFLISDFYIASPNILGFTFGIIQMVLYAVYNKNKNQNQPSAETIVHDSVVEIKSLERNHENNSENPSNKNEIEIVVLDCDEQVPGIVVVTI